MKVALLPPALETHSQRITKNHAITTMPMTNRTATLVVTEPTSKASTGFALPLHPPRMRAPHSTPAAGSHLIKTIVLRGHVE